LTDKRLGFLINFNVFFIKTVLKELYYNLCVFVTLWLNYYNSLFGKTITMFFI